MNTRFAGILFFTILAVVFGLGVFLLIAADEMPAPGLILMAVSGTLLIRRLFSRNTHVKHAQVDEDGPFEAAERARESFQYDVERRQRGEFDTNADSDTRMGKFD